LAVPGGFIAVARTTGTGATWLFATDMAQVGNSLN
jgi:hypothetical protein